MADPYLSEIKYLGAGNIDFVEVAVDAGTDVSNVQVAIYHHTTGNLRSLDGLGTKVQTINGKDVYVISAARSPNFNGLHKRGAVALVDNGTVLQFHSFDETVTANGGPADGLTSTQVGTTGAGESLETTDGGSSYQVQTTPNSGTVPCFISGTQILTRRGYRPVETLAAGDEVFTADNGFQTLRWVGARQLSHQQMRAAETRPIRIPKDAFGPGRPARDLLVSPNHRVLLENAACTLAFATPQVLSAAKFLSGTRGIAPATPHPGMAYHHLLFDRHEVVDSNGLYTESFHPSHLGLDGFDQPVRAEILALFPECQFSENTYGPTARYALKGFEAQLIAQMAA